MRTDDGGSAFPVPDDVMYDMTVKPSIPISGMSLRDYFAAKAMLTFYAPATVGISDGGDLIDTPEAVAQFSYILADAMLVERAK